MPLPLQIRKKNMVPMAEGRSSTLLRGSHSECQSPSPSTFPQFTTMRPPLLLTTAGEKVTVKQKEWKPQLASGNTYKPRMIVNAMVSTFLHLFL